MKHISRENARSRLCLALDVPSTDEAKQLAGELNRYIGLFKVGMELFTAAGPAVVEAIKERGSEVFLDLKYHDIPNTVAQAGRAATHLGVAFFNIHASGGKAMMQGVVEAVREEANRTGLRAPKILAVTVLTSLSDQTLRQELGVARGLNEQVTNFARMAQDSGLDGVIASPLEIKSIRDACGGQFVIMTPGIRPAGGEKQDQERVMTPAEAIKQGADYIVVGRPIRTAKDRIAACNEILNQMVDAYDGSAL